MVYCSVCGTKNTSGSAYCMDCGTTIKTKKTVQQSDSLSDDKKHEFKARKTTDPNPRKPPPQYQQPPSQQINQLQQPIQTTYNQNIYPRQVGYFPRKDPSIAAIISFFFPGIGYAYIGNWNKGIKYLIITYLLYLIVIGFFLHIYTIINSHSETKRINIYHGYPI